MRPRAALFLGALASAGVHLSVALVLNQLPAASSSREVAPGSLNALVMTDVISESEVDVKPGDVRHRAAPLVLGQPETAQSVDDARRGGAGDATGAQQVILLVSEADAITAQDAPMNHFGVGQSQRIAVARERATLETRRATPNPSDAPFLASGTGEHQERRPVATMDATVGARFATQASVVGAATTDSARGAAAMLAGGTLDPTGAPSEGAANEATAAGAADPSPGRGIAGGRGQRTSEAARVASDRPAVDRGPAATLATERDARVRDNIDAELLAAQMLESMVEASQRSGPNVGAGRGGVGGGGDPGSGGETGTGGRAMAYAPGPGNHGALYTRDERYLRWFLDQRARVERGLVFPDPRALAMDQGTTVVRFTVRRDGSLAKRPALLRSSGFGDLDSAALVAIVEAAPFAPLPPELAPGVDDLRVTMPVQFWNPMVR